MNITDKIISIPPYISTTWKNIVSLRVEPRVSGHVLIIELITGTKVEIPNLDRPFIEQLFTYHAKAVESDGSDARKSMMTATIPFPLIFPNLEGLTSIFQHNAEQKETPPLPSEMIEKISEMAKAIAPQELSNMQQPETGCNCPYCQIMRAIHGAPAEPADIEEVVSDADLTFRTWDIKQENEKLYSVTNPLDDKERYNVFLGDPIGCSCGTNHCEHIQAVLKS